MRLLRARTFELVEFLDDKKIPPYAILSHTWGEDEILYQELQQLTEKLLEREAFRKIQRCCEQALQDGLAWAWVDTCCIDKTSSAELSEAINSMFRWYAKSAVCYAYLVDYQLPKSMDECRWFTRGWTLQELIAPSKVVFYSSDWTHLGTKVQLHETLSRVTGIDKELFFDVEYLQQLSIAQRMSWAARRKTTRTEDMAYCLLGLFGINMPLLYGEGKNAFRRLQEELLKTTPDDSLFAWGLSNDAEVINSEYIEYHPLAFDTSLPSNIISLNGFPRQDIRTHQHYTSKAVESYYSERTPLLGLFAESPAQFLHCRDVDKIPRWPGEMEDPPVISARHIRISMPILRNRRQATFSLAILGCRFRFNVIGLLVREWNGRLMGRLLQPILMSEGLDVFHDLDLLTKIYQPLRFKEQSASDVSPWSRTVLRIPSEVRSLWDCESTICISGTVSALDKGLVFLEEDTTGIQAIFRFRDYRAYESLPNLVVQLGFLPIEDSYGTKLEMRLRVHAFQGEQESSGLKLDVRSHVTETITDTVTWANSAELFDEDFVEVRQSDGTFVRYLNKWERAVTVNTSRQGVESRVDIYLQRSVVTKVSGSVIEEELWIEIREP